MRRVLGSVALAVVAAVTLAACGGGSSTTSAKPPASTAPVATTTTDPQAAQRAAVLNDYKGYVDVYVRSLSTSNSSDPGLPEHLTGDALVHQKMDLDGLHSANEALRVENVVSRPVIVSLDPSRAVVDDCLSGVPHYFDLRTGAVRGTVPSGPSSDASEYVLVPDGGAWKVSEKSRKDSVCHA
jgi:hypothetical protein